MEDNWTLQCSIRCVCGHVTTVLFGEKKSCKCGESVWFEIRRNNQIQPFVSAEGFNVRFKFSKPTIVKSKWIEQELTK